MFKDINGQPLFEGDLVVFSQNGYASLRKGTISHFTEKRVMVKADSSGYCRPVEPGYCAKIPKKQETIISRSKLADLEDTSEKMNYLEAGGVDNWEWYGESLAPYWDAKAYWAAKEESEKEVTE